MADQLSAPLVEDPQSSSNQFLPARSVARARFTIYLAVLDVAAVISLSLGAYSWQWSNLVTQDVQICGIYKSILDLSVLSLLRNLSFLLLLTTNSSRFCTSAKYIAMLCSLCALCGLLKFCFLATSTTLCPGVVRSHALVVTAAFEQTLSAAVQAGLVFWLTKSVRRFQELERAIHDAAFSHSCTDLDELDGAGEREGTARARGGARSNTKALLARARPEVKWLITGCAVLIVRLPFSLALPHFVSETIGGLLDKDAAVVRTSITCFIIAGCLDALLDFWCVFLFGYTQQRIIRSLRLDLFRNLLQQEVSYYDTTSTGNISSRLTSDTAEMANDLTWVFRFTIEAIVRIAGIGGYMFYRNWKLAAMACSIIPVIAGVNRYYGVWMAKNAAQVQEALADANSVAQEVISAMKTVFSFANEHQEFKRYEDCVQRHYKLNVKQTIISGVYYMFVSTFLTNMGVQAALLIYGSVLVFDGSMKAQTLLAFMLYQGQLQEYFSNLFNSFTNLVKSAGAGPDRPFFSCNDCTHASTFSANVHGAHRVQALCITRVRTHLRSHANNQRRKQERYSEALTRRGRAGAKVFELLERKCQVKRSGTLKLTNVAGKVSFEGVRFCYKSRDETQPALDDVSFQATPGQLVAFVGPSGGGKSTIFNLIEHFYEPVSGRVCLDDVDVWEFDHQWLHQVIALVGQEPVLFSGSIESNIRYSKDAASSDDIMAAAKIANAHSFITQLPLGYQTGVGERGVQLSGGQKQRVAIARAILQDPAVLLLDEATSALDSESEALVQEALEKAMTGRTTLVIAHRLSTISKADRIVFIQKGRIVETGTHQELLAKPMPAEGALSYRALIEKQAAALAAQQRV